MKVSTFNTEHYHWGQGCDGWKLLTQPGLSVIQERMPVGTSEVAHYHEKAEQFFFVLSGHLTLRFPDGDVELSAHEGKHVPALRPHIAMNLSNADVHFLVVSSPSTAGDRVVTSDMG